MLQIFLSRFVYTQHPQNIKKSIQPINLINMQYKDFVAHDDNKSLLAMNGRMEESKKEGRKRN
jgi:hypothetical protein